MNVEASLPVGTNEIGAFLPEFRITLEALNRSPRTVELYLRGVHKLQAFLRERGNEAWLASPAVVDLDRDGRAELIAPRDERLVVWRADGTVAWAASTSGRIWAPPVVANFVGDENLEVVVAARGNLYMFDARGQPAPGFPVTWRDEMRAVAAGDVDGDGRLEIAAVTTRDLDVGARTDIVNVFRADGAQLPPLCALCSLCLIFLRCLRYTEACDRPQRPSPRSG